MICYPPGINRDVRPGRLGLDGEEPPWGSMQQEYAAGSKPINTIILQGLVSVPFWVYSTSPYSSHDRPYT